MSSLLKYARENGMVDPGTGEHIYYGRADIDGAPFRGPAAPLIRQGEEERRLVRVADAHCEEFDLRDPAQLQRYQAVVDRIINHRAKLLHRQFTDHDGKLRVYVEWAEEFVQDRQLMGFGVPSVPVE